MNERRSLLAMSYARFFWFVLVIMVLGEFIAVLVTIGVLSMDAFALMPFASRELFMILAIGAPFVILFLSLLATRNFQDMVTTAEGIRFPVRSLRQMIRDTPSVVSFADVESLRFFERGGAEYVEVRLRPTPGRRTHVVLPSLWIPDEAEFLAALGIHVMVIQSRPLRGVSPST